MTIACFIRYRIELTFESSSSRSSSLIAGPLNAAMVGTFRFKGLPEQARNADFRTLSSHAQPMCASPKRHPPTSLFIP